MLKTRYIGQGMRLEFRHPVYHTLVTSCDVDVCAADHVLSVPATCVGN